MDFIYVEDLNKKKKKMEVVTTMELEGYPSNYIVYCELDHSHYYVAKYKDNIEELDTNLTEKEIELCTIIVNEVRK